MSCFLIPGPHPLHVKLPHKSAPGMTWATRIRERKNYIFFQISFFGHFFLFLSFPTTSGPQNIKWRVEFGEWSLEHEEWSLEPKNGLPEFFVEAKLMFWIQTLICRGQRYQILSKNCQKWLAQVENSIITNKSIKNDKTCFRHDNWKIRNGQVQKVFEHRGHKIEDPDLDIDSMGRSKNEKPQTINICKQFIIFCSEPSKSINFRILSKCASEEAGD